MIYELRIKSGKNRMDGFTIIEMMVAVALFSVVMMAAMTSFLNMNDILSKAESIRTASDNFNFVFETMMRDIRTGTDYANVVSGDKSAMKFVNPQGDEVTYQLNDTSIERKCHPVKGVCGNYSSQDVFVRLTAPTVTVTNLEFDIQGVGADQVQPRTTILINGYAGLPGREKTKAYFNLQTTVSQRSLER